MILLVIVLIYYFDNNYNNRTKFLKKRDDINTYSKSTTIIEYHDKTICAGQKLQTNIALVIRIKIM